MKEPTEQVLIDPVGILPPIVRRIGEEKLADGIVLKMVKVDAHPDGSKPWERPKKSRVYLWPEGENVLENLASRFARPHTAYRKLLPEALALVAIDPKAKAHWSQYAGCRCGCSPGFIVDNDYGRSIHVTYAIDTEGQVT